MDPKITAAGKHVKCEKPIGLNLSEATLMEEEKISRLARDGSIHV
jgi:predicted dehydrogenase